MIYMSSCFPLRKRGRVLFGSTSPSNFLNAENWHTGQFSDSNFDSSGTATLLSTSGP